MEGIRENGKIVLNCSPNTTNLAQMSVLEMASPWEEAALKNRSSDGVETAPHLRRVFVFFLRKRPNL